MSKDEPRRERSSSSKKGPAPRVEPPADPVFEGEFAVEWDGGAPRRTLSFYHADGAPYLDDQGKFHKEPPEEEMEELQRQGLVLSPTIIQEVVGEAVPVRELKKKPDQWEILGKVYPARVEKPAKGTDMAARRARRELEESRGARDESAAERKKGQASEELRGAQRESAAERQKERASEELEAAQRESAAERQKERASEALRGAQRESAAERPRGEGPQESRPAQDAPKPKVSKAFDVSFAEELVYLAIKKMFSGGITIPIRKEGMADLDIVIKDKDVVLDIDKFYPSQPLLHVWRVTFAYKGEPLAYYGRGVKGDLKILPFPMARFLIQQWYQKRTRLKLEKRQARALAGKASGVRRLLGLAAKSPSSLVIQEGPGG
jgi:hypothetical protein